MKHKLFHRFVYLFKASPLPNCKQPCSCWPAQPCSCWQAQLCSCWPAQSCWCWPAQTGPGWVLKCIYFWHSNLPYFKNNLSVDNECKCQILSLINIPLYFTGIAIYIQYIYTELTPKLTAMASVAQSVEHWSRNPGSRVQLPARGLGVAFVVTGPGWVLKCIYFWHSNLPYFKNNLSVDNKCKCQILSLIYPTTLFMLASSTLLKLVNSTLFMLASSIKPAYWQS